jgi:CelD/BcsL family acetyltransferase involved in cellulose biosynthesis
VIESLSHLVRFKHEWNEVHETSSSHSPLSSFEFIKGWYSCFKDHGKIRVYRIRSCNETIGFIPLILVRKKGIRELQNLWKMEIANPEPVVRQGCEREFQELLLRRIVETRHMWDVFCIKLSYTFSRFPGLFTDEQLIQAGLKWDREREPTYCIALTNSFDEYFQQDLGKKLRRSYNLSNNRLQKLGDYSFFHVSGREAVEYWLVFLKLEGSGWKGDKGTAIIKIDANKKRYYDLLLDIMAGSGNLNMYFLKISGKIVAGSFGYLDGEIYHEAKSAYDEKFGYFSPSNLLRVYMIKDIITRFPAVTRIHMFPWDYGYKHRWDNEQHACITTNIYSTSPRGRLVHCLKKTKQKVREKSPVLYAVAKKIRRGLFKQQN